MFFRKAKDPDVAHVVLYRFTCERCGHECDWQRTLLSGKSELDIINYVIPEAKAAAKEHFYFDLAGISGKCKHCGSYQSWEINEARRWMKRGTIIGLCFALASSVVMLFLLGLVGVAFVFGIGIAVGFLWGFLMYMRIMICVGKTTNRFSPQIDWFPEENGDRQCK